MFKQILCYSRGGDTLLKQESRRRKRSLVLSEFRLCLLSIKITYKAAYNLRIYYVTLSWLNIIHQNKRPVCIYVIKLYVVLLQPLSCCFQRSQNESTGSFILSQEEVPSKGFFQAQTFHNLRNVSSRPGKHRIDAKLLWTCTAHLTSKIQTDLFTYMAKILCFENYQCQSCETESIYSSGGNQQEGPAPWRVHADTVMLLPNQENIAVRARPAHQLVIVSQNGNKHALCWTHPLGGEGPAYSVTSSPLKSSPESNVLPDVQNEECSIVCRLPLP